MNFLRRTDWQADGIFGEFFFSGEQDRFCVTLEHSYQQPDGRFIAKVPVGTYTCRRGTHQLHGGFPFETFEILGVPGHSGILFHAGNFNKDSEGCVLIGTARRLNPSDGQFMITGSRQEFSAFMQKLGGVQEFDLEVS